MFVRSWIRLSFIHEANAFQVGRVRQSQLDPHKTSYTHQDQYATRQIQSQCAQQVDTVSCPSTSLRWKATVNYQTLQAIAFGFTCQRNYVRVQYLSATVVLVFSRDWLFTECFWSDQYHFVVEWFERWLERKQCPLKSCFSELQLHVRIEDAEYLLTY